MKVAGYTVGGALIAIGAAGLLTNAADTHPIAWALWLVGVVVAHDFVVVPVVLAVAALVVRLPKPYRTPVQVAAMLGGCVTAVALPLVLGYGRVADNPSQLPLSYGRNLLAVLSIIAVGTFAVILARRRAGHPGVRRPGTGRGPGRR